MTHRFISSMLSISRLTLLILLSILINIAATANDSNRIAELRQMADSLHSIGKTDSAVILGKEAILLAEKTKDPVRIIGANATQGVFLRSLGKIEEAQACYSNALNYITDPNFRKNPTQEGIEETASLYINLAVLNLDLQHKEEAAKNAILAGEWVEKSSDVALKSMIDGVVGSVLTGCGNLKEAKKYTDKAYQFAIESNDPEAAFRSASYSMLIADRMGDKKEAARWREICGKMLPELESVMAKLVYYQAECSICLKNDNKREALKWFDEILNLDGIDNLPFIKFDCYNNMHLAYSDLGDYKEAYSILLKSNELRDSLWNIEKTESLRDLTVKYETKETQLALAQSESRRARTLIWLFGILIVLLIVTLLFIIYVNKARRLRLKREMEFAALKAETGRKLTEQYIEGLENERRRMSRELHDGVCNDLLAIKMNIKNGASLNETESLIDTCREAVRRVSHELMPPEFAYASIDEVVRYMVNKYKGDTNEISITYSSKLESGKEWEEIPDHIALEIYRIIQESISNALRHSGGDIINVSLDYSQSGITAEITDNGRFNNLNNKGVGTDSMRRRAAAINGNLRISSSEDNGTTVTLYIPSVK